MIQTGRTHGAMIRFATADDPDLKTLIIVLKDQIRDILKTSTME